MIYIDAREHSLVNDEVSHVLDNIIIKAHAKDTYILDATLECLECGKNYDVIARLNLKNNTIEMIKDYTNTIGCPKSLLFWLVDCGVEIFGHDNTFTEIEVL